MLIGFIFFATKRRKKMDTNKFQRYTLKLLVIIAQVVIGDYIKTRGGADAIIRSSMASLNEILEEIE